MTRAPGRIRAGWVTLTETSAAASVVLAVLTIACVFVAMAGPRQSLGFRTTALRQTIDAQPLLARSVVADMPLISLSVSASATGGSAVVPLSTLRQGGYVLGQNLARQPLPLQQAPARWFGLTADYVAVRGAARRAYYGPGVPPQLALIYRNALAEHSRVLAGTYPNTETVIKGVPVFQIAVTPATAYRFGLHVGSVLARATLRLRVAGIIRPAGPPSDFWQAFATAPGPVLNGSLRLGYKWLGSAFIGAGEVTGLQTAIGTSTMAVEWDLPLDLRNVNADQAVGLLNNLVAAETADGNVVPASAYSSFGGPVSANLSSGLINPLTSFVAADAQIGSLMSLLYVSLTVVGTVMLLLGCRLLAERRSAEFSLMRARGASAGQLSLLAARAGAVVVLPAAAASAALAISATPGDGEPLAWWLGGMVVLVALAGVAVLAVRLAPPASAVSQRADQPVSRINRARRWVADITLVMAAVAGLLVLRQQGPAIAGSPDYYTSAAPVLVAVPIAIMVVRIFPTLARWLARVAGRRPGVTSFVGLARAARSSIGAVLPAFALVLALAVVAFGATMQTAIRGGQEAASWQATGADVIIDGTASPFAVTGSVQRAVAAVPGVQRVVAVSVQPGSTANGGALSVSVVDPGRYAALIAATPDQPFGPAALARPAAIRPGQAIPVIASPAAVAQIGRNGTIHVGTYNVRIRVAGTIRTTPAGAGSAFVIVASQDAVAFGRPAANELLLSGPSADGGRLQQLASRLLPGATVTLRSAALAALTSAPLPHGAYVTFLLAAIAAAVLCAAILLILLVLGARPRELTLARLATMGLSAGQSRRLVFVEALPAIIAAIAGGIASALILVPLIAPAINLSVFTGTGVATKMRLDVPVIGYVAAGLLVVALATLLAQIALTRARGVTRALRVGE